MGIFRWKCLNEHQPTVASASNSEPAHPATCADMVIASLTELMGGARRKPSR